MLIDALSLPDSEVLQFDIVIIGAGLAGLSMAYELAATRKKVCLVESGEETRQDDYDNLNTGFARLSYPNGRTEAMDEFLKTSRERALGGSGNLWGGKCAELEPIDFEQRQWVSGSGWPIRFRDIKPYYHKACHHFRIPIFSGQHEPQVQSLGASNRDDFSTVYRRFSCITGTDPGNEYFQYKYALAEMPNMTILKNASIQSLECNESGVASKKISKALARSLNGLQLQIQSDHFILAAGGLENPRVLLNSDRQQADGIGNEYGQVGRYYSGHIVFKELNFDTTDRAFFIPNASLREHFTLYSDKHPSKIHGLFSVSHKAQMRQRMQGFCVAMEHVPALDDDSRIPLNFMTEFTPNAESRVTLSDELDLLGQRKLKLEWKILQQDMDNLQQGIELFQKYIDNKNYGRIEIGSGDKDTYEAEEFSRHHIGTTRMSTDPQTGVVDANCKVYGTDNLYVIGTSVFPTGGLANPTLTITALAFRLVDHLRPKLNQN